MKIQNISVTEFCKKMGITEAQFYGKEQIESNLYWGRVKHLPQGICLDVVGYIDLENLTELSANTTIKSTKWIGLPNLTKLGQNCNLSAGRDLELDALTEFGENCRLEALYLYLFSMSEIPKHCTVDVKGKVFLKE